MLHQTFLFLGQLWQLFEVSHILEFLRYLHYAIQTLLNILRLLHFTNGGVIYRQKCSKYTSNKQHLREHIIFSDETKLLYSASLLRGGQPFKERICSSGSKFFSLSADTISKSYMLIQKGKEEVKLDTISKSYMLIQKGKEKVMYDFLFAFLDEHVAL